MIESITFYFLQGAALALTAAISPGPYQAFLLSRSLSAGWRRTLPAAFASLVTDGPILAMALFALTHTPPWFLQGLRIAGGLFILHLAGGIHKVLKSAPLSPAQPSGGRPVKSLLDAVAINALNPNPYIFWGVVGGPLVLSGWRISPGVGTGFLVGFFGTFIASLGVQIILFAGAGKLNPTLNRILLTVSLIALCLFGLYQIARGLLFWF